jgi:hypothetical protein
MTRGSSASHLPSTTFCWFPPLSVATGASMEEALTGQRCGGVSSGAGLGDALDETKTGIRFECRERHVVAHCHRRDDAAAATILGIRHIPARIASRGESSTSGWPSSSTRPDTAGTTPQIVSASSEPSRADQAGNAEHLAAVDCQRDLGEGIATRADAVEVQPCLACACFHRLARRLRRRSRGRPSGARDDRA